MSEDSFDAIVIGAGLAGLSAAYTLAKAGKSVLVIERGDAAGSKNVSGGRIYTYALELLEPGLTAQACLERAVTHEQLMLLDGERSLLMEYVDPAFGAPPAAQSYTVLRAPFDAWLAEQAEAQGAFIAAGVRVDGLIEQNGRIVGVRAGDDEMRAEVVIAADGVNSLMMQRAGLRAELRPHEIGIGVKEVIALPAAEIESRFHLKPGEGAARMILGGADGLNGGVFLYTNRDSLSLGCVFLPHAVADGKRSIQQVLQQIKLHPDIRALIEGGRTLEYGAHLVPEGGWTSAPKTLHRPGFLVVGDAAGFCINQGFTIRGMDLAILSGVAAGQAVLAESDASLVGPVYVRRLEELGLPAAMQQYAKFPALMENPRLFSVYPALATDVFRQLYGIKEAVPAPLITRILGAVRRNSSYWSLLKDGWQILRALK